RQLLEPGNDVVLDRGDQSRVDLLVDVEKRLTIHGIDPVVYRRAQTQTFPCHVMTRQRRFFSVIDTHVPITVVAWRSPQQALGQYRRSPRQHTACGPVAGRLVFVTPPAS